MTVAEALAQIREIKPNPYPDETLVRYLNTLDAMLKTELLSWHEAPKKSTEDEEPEENNDPYSVLSPNTVLLVPDPYSEIYIRYLSAQIDLNNGELARYNNSMILYNTALSAYADYVNRTQRPVLRAPIRI